MATAPLLSLLLGMAPGVHALGTGALSGASAAPGARAQVQVRSGAFQDARVWYVDDDACPSGGGTGTHAAPLCAIQEAIDRARDGDLVLVAPGSYRERIDFRGKAIRLVASEGPSVTEIRPFPASSPPPVVRFASGEGPGSVLDGFTITGHSGVLGAVHCEGASPTIVRNVIADNRDHGISCLASGARILSNALLRNGAFGPATTGAGLYASGSELLVAGNTIVDNGLATATPDGAGIYLEDCTARLLDNVVAGNACTYLGISGTNRGAGLFAQRSSVELLGNTFTDNLASVTQFTSGQGGAIACVDSELWISSTILWGDTVVGGGLFPPQGPEVWAQNSFVHLDHCDVEGGLAGIYASGGTLEWGQGNVVVDPLLRDPGADDYRLSPGSPLIDAGPPDQPPGGLDAEGDPRVLDGDLDGAQRVDVGADELDPTTLVASGVAIPGGALTLATGAPAGWVYELLASDAPGDEALAPFGSLLLAAHGLRVVAVGSVPGTDTLAIPAEPSLLGRELWLQSLGLDPGGATGAFSGALRLVVH